MPEGEKSLLPDHKLLLWDSVFSYLDVRHIRLPFVAQLQAWKLKYLNEHLERLLRLASDSTLREELTAFPLAKNAAGGIAEQHRQGKGLRASKSLSRFV